MRGPGILPADPGTPALRTARQKFDQLVLDVVTPLDERWQRHLGLVEYAVEDAPMLPDDWGDETVPLSSLVRGKGQAPTRLVIFRRPVEHRATNRDELEAMVHTVVVEQLAELLEPHARPGRREVRRRRTERVSAGPGGRRPPGWSSRAARAAARTARGR